MKGKILLFTAAVTALVGANTFAAEIHKGKLLSHKEWSTGNLKFSFAKANSADLAKLVQSQKLAGKSGSYTMATLSFATAQSAAVGEAVTLTGMNRAEFINATDSTQKYGYISGVCTDVSATESQCAYYYDQFELEPQGSYGTDAQPTLQYTYAQPGSYSKTIFSYVDTEDGDVLNESASNAIIDVTDSHKK